MKSFRPELKLIRVLGFVIDLKSAICESYSMQLTDGLFQLQSCSRACNVLLFGHIAAGLGGAVHVRLDSFAIALWRSGPENGISFPAGY
jgi:hypothetical protein